MLTAAAPDLGNGAVAALTTGTAAAPAKRNSRRETVALMELPLEE